VEQWKSGLLAIVVVAIAVGVTGGVGVALTAHFLHVPTGSNTARLGGLAAVLLLAPRGVAAGLNL